LSTIALTGITIDRKVTRRSRKAAIRTKPKTSGRCDFIVSLKSFELAVKPPTSAVALSTRPIVAGTRSLRSWASAALDCASLPSPARGMSISATVRSGLTVVVIGCLNSGFAAACLRRSLMAPATWGEVTLAALTATTAGMGPPGKTFWTLL
jgi:hypothetical protein